MIFFRLREEHQRTALPTQSSRIFHSAAKKKAQTGTAWRALRGQLARGFGEDLRVQVDIGLGRGGAH
jgi:hypothetical protein